MGLIKTRPEISLFGPQVMRGGSSYRVRVVLDCSEPVPVDELLVSLVCTGVYWTRSDKGRHRHEIEIWRATARPLTEATELAPVQHEYAVQFAVPVDVPSTYIGGELQVLWTYDVRADIPWWPDAKASFEAFVAPNPVNDPSRDARVFTSSLEGPPGKKPYAEVSLGDVIPGEYVEGKIALSNTAHNDYQGVELELQAIESVPVFFGQADRHTEWGRWRIPISNPTENEPIAFKFKIPLGVVPPFETRKFALRWGLNVRLDVAWALDEHLWIPLPVRASGSGDEDEIVAPYAVGSDRIASVWAKAGREHGFNYRAGELSREEGDARLVVRREHHGRKGLRLVGEIFYPDLDLGLRREGDRIRSRDAQQSEIIARHTDPAAEGLYMWTANDERIKVGVDDAGINRGPVADMAQRLLKLWTALDRAREELPAPADMNHAVEAFRSAARRLGGELDAASMDIRGSRTEIPYALEVQWGDDGAVARTVLEVRPALPVDGRWHQSWHPGEPPNPTPEGLQPLLPGAQGLEITAERIRIVFPPCGAEVEPHVERLEGLLEVARRLSGHGPGYR